MKNQAKFLLITLTCCFLGCGEMLKAQNKSMEESKMYDKMSLQAPVAKKVAKEMTIHGDMRVDNYYWMNQREDISVINHLNEENAYKDSLLAHTAQFQNLLFEEIKGRIKQTDMSVPYTSNGYSYQTKYEEGKEYPIYVRNEVDKNGKESVMLDVNKLAAGFSYYNVSGRSVSPDNKLLAYGEDTLSRRIYTIKLKNLETGEMLPDVIPNTTGSAVWGNDNSTLFYTVKDESLRAYKIYRHILGTDTSKDELLFHEKDDTFSVYCWKSKSKKFIMIGSFQTLASEFRTLDADKPRGEFKLFQERDYKNKLEYSVSHFEDKFYIKTNLDAKNFRVMETPIDATGKENWKEVIAHRDDVLIEGVEIFKDFKVISERVKGITNLRVIKNSGEDYNIEFPDNSYLAYTSVNPEFDTNLLRIGYTSLTTPNSTFDFDVNTKKMNLLKQQEVLGKFDAGDYVSERLFAKSRDGVEVPISLVYRKDTKLGDDTPLLLYGYGSYGNSMDPYFSSTRLTLLDRGFVFAIAHIRGGEEMGRQWYEDGKLLKKKNTFNDFIDCAEYLIAKDYTSKDNLYGMGGSAGGLLIGAVINMRPDLWKGVIAAVPFVDVVTTMLDETIPLTTGEFDEWGNPKNKEYYDYIKTYSPYDNIEKKDYPAMMVTTGLHDSQVQYWEPAKWVAKLRTMKTDNNPLIMHCNMTTGHGGASGRFERFKETAMQYAFFLDLAGKTDTPLKQ